MKLIVFVGDSLARLSAFPFRIRRSIGYQLDRAQRGLDRADGKPKVKLGLGLDEIRLDEAAGTYRAIYLTDRAAAVYVLHAFIDNGQRIAARDLKLIQDRRKDVGRAAAKSADEFECVWKALERTLSRAANMKARSELMIALKNVADQDPDTAAKRLGLNEPRAKGLVEGRINNFKVDALVNIAGRVGINVRVTAA